MGYRDSANLYAYCAGDPINCSDPTGEADDDQEDPLTTSLRALFRGFNDEPDYCRQDPSDERCLNDYQRWLKSHFGDEAPQVLRNYGLTPVS